jgi:hypothetical protein
MNKLPNFLFGLGCIMAAGSVLWEIWAAALWHNYDTSLPFAVGFTGIFIALGGALKS